MPGSPNARFAASGAADLKSLFQVRRVRSGALAKKILNGAGKGGWLVEIGNMARAFDLNVL